MGLPEAAHRARRARAAARRRRFPPAQPRRAGGLRRPAGGGPARRAADRRAADLPARGRAARSRPARLDRPVPVQRAARGPVHPAEDAALRHGLRGPALRRGAGPGRTGHGHPAVRPVPVAGPARGERAGAVRGHHGQLPRPAGHPDHATPTAACSPTGPRPGRSRRRTRATRLRPGVRRHPGGPPSTADPRGLPCGPAATEPLGLFAPFARRVRLYAAWNCSASVEPDRATVSAFGEIAEVTRSK